MRSLGFMIGVYAALLVWATSTAVAQDSSFPKATVSIGLGSVAAEPWGGCTYYFTESGAPQPGGACGDPPFPPARFADLTATGEPAIIRFDRPLELYPYAVLSDRDPARRMTVALTPLQRDGLTWEVVLPSVNEARFLTFGGRWSGERVQGSGEYIVGLLPVPQDSALEIRKARWTGARLTASGKVHPYAASVALSLACNDRVITKTVPATAGQWRIALRTPSACATRSSGRLVARVSSTDRLRAGKVSLRLTHRLARR